MELHIGPPVTRPINAGKGMEPNIGGVDGEPMGTGFDPMLDPESNHRMHSGAWAANRFQGLDTSSIWYLV